MEILTASILGSITGIVAGLLPGIGVTSVLLILYFWLAEMPLTWILSFYISLLVVSQYMGSVSATVLGVLGEASSIPALKEGHAMAQQGLASQALAICCIGSAVGSLIAVILAAGLLQSISALFVLNYAQVKILFVVLLFVLVIKSSPNPWWISIAMIVAGSALGRIGYHNATGQTWGTLGIDALDIGIPSVLLLVCFFAIPSILTHFNQSQLAHTHATATDKITASAALRTQPWLATVRGSVIGFFTGAIPYLSFVASSKFAWAVERWIDRGNQMPGHGPSLAAAETANNAGALTSLLPLLLFAVPITLSEIVLLDIITFSHQQGISWNWLLQGDHLAQVLTAFAMANVVGIVAAWPMGQFFVSLIGSHNRSLIAVAMSIMTATVLWAGYEISQTVFYITVGLILFAAGWLLRHRDVVPLVLGFLLVRHLELSLWVTYQKLF